MKKRLAAAIMTISAAIMISGCFPTGEKKPNISEVISESEIFEYNKDNFTASFNIPRYQNTLPTKIKLKEKKFDTDEMIDLFYSCKTILQDKTWNGNYYADDDSLLCVDSNSILFCDGKTAPIKKFQIDAPLNYQAVLTVADECYREIFDIGTELEGFSSQSAESRANELISTLGITNLGEPEVFAFSVNTLEKLKENDLAFAFNEEFPITKDNEVYILRYSRLVDEIELADVKLSIKNTTNEKGSSSVSSPKVTVGISKDEIFYFNAEEVYEPECEIINSEPAKYGLNYAVSELTSYLDKAFFTSKTTITKAKPVYIPVERNSPEYTEFSLAWCFEGISDTAADNYHKDDYKIFFLADTGRMIEYK